MIACKGSHSFCFVCVVFAYKRQPGQIFLSLTRMCLISVFTHLKKMARLPRDAGVMFYFWKHNKVVLASSSSFNSFRSSDDGNKCEKKRKEKTAWPGGLALISCLIRASEPNWGQVRQRKSLCQRRRLSPIEQRLTFCLMNHGNPKENHTNAQSCHIPCLKSSILLWDYRYAEGYLSYTTSSLSSRSTPCFSEGSSKIFHGVIKRSVLSNKVLEGSDVISEHSGTLPQDQDSPPQTKLRSDLHCGHTRFNARQN